METEGPCYNRRFRQFGKQQSSPGQGGGVLEGPADIIRFCQAYAEYRDVRLLRVSKSSSSLSLLLSDSMSVPQFSSAGTLNLRRFFSRTSNSSWRTRFRSDGGVGRPVEARPLRYVLVRSWKFESPPRVDMAGDEGI